MANEYLVNSDDLVAVATAIREKGGTEDPLIFPDGFISAVQEIQTGGDGTVEDFVRFYDYDGTLLYVYTLSDAKKLTSFPDVPSHSGLVFDGWNYTLEKMQNLTTSRNIYALYSTDDETTRIHVRLKEGRTSPMLGICLNGTVTVDWGDGTTADVLTGTDLTTAVFTPLHNYSKSGNYVIKLTIDGNAQLCGDSSNNGSYILRHGADANSLNQVYQSSIYKIEIGSRIGIGDYAFGYCFSLTSISMPNGVTSIGNYAFRWCYSLTSISMPNGVTSIGTCAFDACYSLTNISIPDGVTSISNYTFNSCYSLTGSISIPDGVTSIGNYAFNTCFPLTSISIPNGVTSIGVYAFAGCSSLTNISMPNGVTNIGNRAFNNCYSLTSISIPDGVTSIGDYEFASCSSLTNISMPNGVTSIGNYAFSACYSLTSISIPDGVTSIGTCAFDACCSLASISMPNGVTSIGASAFRRCSGVKYYDFSSLQSIPTLKNGSVFNEISPDCEIRVPAALAEEWKAATNWATYADYIVGV